VASNLARELATGTGVGGREKFGRGFTDGGENPNGLNRVGWGGEEAGMGIAGRELSDPIG